MAVIRDNMPAFELFQPASTDEALGLLEQYGTTAWVLAGGLDTWDWLKDRVKRPAAVVDLGAIAALREIRTTADGVEIGAMVPLTEVERSSAVRESYGLLAAAAAVVASPGDLGGEPESGHAVLVLPGRVELLPRGRQHLLRRGSEHRLNRCRVLCLQNRILRLPSSTLSSQILAPLRHRAIPGRSLP